MRAFWFWLLERRWDERWRGTDVLIREDYCCNLEVDFFPAMLICPVTYGSRLQCNVRQNCRADPGLKLHWGIATSDVKSLDFLRVEPSLLSLHTSQSFHTNSEKLPKRYITIMSIPNEALQKVCKPLFTPCIAHS
jgi:hypothetical protein